eukprot:8798097-Pyramimonas_sp.AAC.1
MQLQCIESAIEKVLIVLRSFEGSYTMRKCITVALVFFAGFLVSFNVVRNIYTLTQYRVHTHNEDSLAHHSFGSEVSEVRSAHKQQQQVEEIVDDIDDEAVDAIQDEEVAPEEEKEADPPPPPPSPPSPTAAKPSQQQANTDCTGEACGCHTEKNAEYWGDVVMWGQNHFEPSAEACCAACRNFKPKGQGTLRSGSANSFRVSHHLVGTI